MGFLARALTLLVADLSFYTIAFRPISPNKLLRSCFSLADRPMWFQICNACLRFTACPSYNRAHSRSPVI